MYRRTKENSVNSLMFSDFDIMTDILRKIFRFLVVLYFKVDHWTNKVNENIYF